MFLRRIVMPCFWATCWMAASMSARSCCKFCLSKALIMFPPVVLYTEKGGNGHLQVLPNNGVNPIIRHFPVVFRHEIGEPGVQNVGVRTVRLAADAASGALHQLERRLPLVPCRIALLAGANIRSERRVRHLANDLDAAQVLLQVQAFHHGWGEQD